MLGLGLSLTSPAIIGTHVPFSPIIDLAASLKFWLSADDHGTSRMTDDGAGVISSWSPYVGSAGPLTATTTARPVWTATGFNSAYPVLTGNGTTTAMVTTTLTGLPTSSTESWILAVVDNTEANGVGATRVAASYGSGANGGDRIVQRFVSGSETLARASDGTTSATQGITTTPKCIGPHVIIGKFASSVLNVRINAADSTDAAVTLATGATRMRVFARNGGGASSFWAGGIRHIMVLGAITLSEKLKLEGWAYWDSGLQGNLPAAHPYKTARPMQ